MQLVRRGRPDAFAVVYERHCGSAYALAYRMTGTPGAAEDVGQEAFLSVWRSGARYDRRRGSVRSWILGIVHDRAVEALPAAVAPLDPLGVGFGAKGSKPGRFHHYHHVSTHGIDGRKPR